MEDKYYSSLQPWTVPAAFSESCWFDPDACARETEALTRALQISLSTDVDSTDVLNAGITAAGSYSPVANPARADSAFDEEMPPSRARSPALSPPAGKVSKRKPRPPKQSTTTFFAADPSNFRHTVQQLTGIPFARRAHAAPGTVLRPNPRLPRNRAEVEGSCLPTLDTSALLLEREQEGVAAGTRVAPSPISQAFFRSGDAALHSFPTLESWHM